MNNQIIKKRIIFYENTSVRLLSNTRISNFIASISIMTKDAPVSSIVNNVPIRAISSFGNIAF